MTGAAWLPAASCAVQVTFTVPARKSVPFAKLHETTTWLGGSSGSVADTEIDRFVQNVRPHPAVASATMLPGLEITGGVVSTALRVTAPLAAPGIATIAVANRRLTDNLMTPDYVRATENNSRHEL